jgi:DNA (cytosine-5)-methyltransferase 1
MSKRQVKRSANHNLISLFSGAMGLDLGLESEGFQVAGAVELNTAAVRTIKANRPELPVIKEDIEQVSATDLLKKFSLRKKEVTLISGGPCCQAFSTVGKRHSLSDPRGSLFRHYCRVVSNIRPRFFVMENVKGILSAAIKHRPLDQRGAGHPPLTKEELLGSAFDLILHELSALNYYVVYGLLNSADFGVPQKRWRVFFIGSRDGESISLPTPTHRDPATNGTSDLLDWVTLREVLKSVSAEQWTPFTPERLGLLRLLKAGQNWRDLPPSLHRKALGAAYDSWGGRVGFCRRLAWNEPTPTLTTAPDGRATTLCHPEQDRPLSVEEYAALQQFPPSWKFEGSVNQQYVQIGNAVPLGLGAAIGRMLKKAIADTNETNPRLRGKVICGDPLLQERLKHRKKTKLHPPRLRKVADDKRNREWLSASASL